MARDYSNMTQTEILAEQARSRAKREAEAEGDVDAAKIAEDIVSWDGTPAYTDDVAEIVAGIEEEEEA